MTDTNTYAYVDADTLDVRIVRGEADTEGTIVGRVDAAGLPALSESADKLLATLGVRPVSDWRDVEGGLFAVVEETAAVPTAG
ncbi:hypothetical protein I6A60_00240 [Frankia sp. AgB1.9]|uniref:hypothetical protein n=1 Tax=unclassified Frankia TaxID=2632575 RepID=UPI001933443A|nr:MULTISPECIES: hypothetical protein [unclassified Frankia]MBL7487309.1 hypothetical protein [Frankia sp. AgW1.1]MBL7546316.1 hypothetical protein [Frankia sp. AgB1.9]MBL7618639.1 hypothetical protein [Frankia sp. AgB1.8]